MRTEVEMMNLILDTAKNEERIRAVILNGSRSNPNRPKDIFQDYDIVFIVKDMNFFMSDNNFIDIFGDRIMLQMPKLNRNPMNDGHFDYLMLLADGNRVDLQLIPLEKVKELLGSDNESKLLMDKDNIFVSGVVNRSVSSGDF